MNSKRISAATVFTLVFALTVVSSCVCAYARDGIGGYDGSGISSGDGTARTAFEFQEYLFVTGTPILLKGTLIVTKSENSGKTTSAYSYKLSNPAYNIQLTRDFAYETVSTAKDGGQTVTETRLAREPSEKIVYGQQTYTLRAMEFTRTSLIDAKPAVNYYSGNTWYRKYFEAGGGASASSSGNYLVVEATGSFYGFDQYWGSADIEDTHIVVEYTQNSAAGWGGIVGRSEAGGIAGGAVGGAGGTGGVGGSAPYNGVILSDDVRELWSGTADVKRSQTAVTEIRYVDNEPQAISFRGGFLETRRNDSVLEYDARLPEFDAAGNATERLKKYTNSSQITTFPYMKRLVSPYLRQINGHWAEEAVSRLFGLEIFKTRPTEFNADQYITRAEFAAALVAAAPPVPEDAPVRRGAARRTGGRGNAAPKPSFTDVPADHEYFAQIEAAFARGLMTPIDKNEFRPSQKLPVADAAVMFVRALGLSAVASAHGSLTEFTDDAAIPAYARDAVYILQKIRLLRGDERGAINPLKELTQAEAAVMIDRLVEYMRMELKLDYREHIMDY